MADQLPLPQPGLTRESPRWSETLRDRRRVWIRPLVPEDAEAERAFIEGLSAQTRRDRFHGQMRSPGTALLQRLTRIDQVHDVAFAAVVPEDSHQCIVGVSRYSLADDGRQCECAVVVSDDWQGCGLGTVLMRHLIEHARRQGVARMVSVDAAENARMHDFAGRLGFETEMDPEDATRVVHTLDL